MTYRAAVEFVQTHYMLRLADAPFDTADNELPAGACGPCARRTGNELELFNDVKGPDICTDPACFRIKVKAAAAAKRAQLEAEGRTVLSAAQAKKLYQGDSIHLVHNSEYLELDGEVWVGNRQVKVAALLRKHAPKTATVFCQRPDGVLAELAARKEVERATAKARPKEKGQARTSARRDPKEERREAERIRREERADLVREATLTLVLEKLPKAKDAVLWMLLAWLTDGILMESSDDEKIERLFARYGAKLPADWNRLRAAVREIVGADTARARAVVLETTLLNVSTEDQDAALHDLVKHLHITPDQVKRRANAEQAAAAERAKQEKTKTKGAEDGSGEDGPEEEESES